MSYSPPPPPYEQGQGGHYSAPRNSPKALWSLILGILGLVFCGIFAGIPALILGSSARKEIAASQGALTGDGMAKAGVILGWISVALTVVAIILALTGVLTFNATVNGP